MKTRTLVPSLFLLIAFFCQPLFAGELLFGVKAGLLDLGAESDVPDMDTKKAKNINLQLGYEFLDLALADIAVEAEVSQSQSEGEIDGTPWDFDSQALYLSARTAGPFYLIARAGIANVKSTEKVMDAEPLSISDTGKSLGVGVGFSLGLRFEVEYTTFEISDDVGGDLDLKMVTLGVAF